MKARYLLSVLAAVAAAWPAVAAYPERPVTLVVNSAPGGGRRRARARPRGRAVASVRPEVIVENKTGAGGNVAAGQVARAAPDGYTLLLADAGMVAINPTLYGALPFDPQKDFVPVRAPRRLLDRRRRSPLGRVQDDRGTRREGEGRARDDQLRLDRRRLAAGTWRPRSSRARRESGSSMCPIAAARRRPLT
jgi:hypothetical protein